jgi:N-acetylglucosamine kinase-like BadF-type ATPase
MTNDELAGDTQTSRPVNQSEIATNTAKFVIRHSSLVIGLDAGGTKTACALARADDSAVLGRGVGGPGNIHAAGAERVAASLADAVREAFQDAGLMPGPVAAVALGAAGAARPDDQAAVERLLRAAAPAERYAVTNDGAIALRAAVPVGPGVLIVAGTGSIGYGRTTGGDEVRTGGWGYLLGDEGSAFAVGLAGLAAVLRAHDGRAQPTGLSAVLLDAWALTTPEGLIARVYRQPAPREEIAALAPLVAAAARAGDTAAAGIMHDAGGALGELAVSTARKLGLPPATPAPVVTTGGFWHTAADLLLPPLLVRVRAASVVIAHHEAVVEPVYGALALARTLLDPQP